MINIKFHKLLKYLSEMVFKGILIVGVFNLAHVINKINIVIDILLRLDHFCLELGNKEIT